MKNELTHLDLFSGIGGFALAAGWAGFRTIAFSEIEPAACEILRRQFPDIPNAGDIHKLAGKAYSGVSLITGGFPCQPFSVAGKRRGKEDDRHLWPEMLRIISEARPAWVVGENVAGIVKMELDSVLSDLEAIGYECQALIVPAVAVDAKHRRDRVWIVAYADADRRNNVRQGEKSLKREACSWSFAPSQQRAHSFRVEAVADADGRRRGQHYSRERIISIAVEGSANNANPNLEPAERASVSREEHCEWQSEPDMGRVAHGIPNRSHRIKGLGNAIVPQVALEILKGIAEIESTHA